MAINLAKLLKAAHHQQFIRPLITPMRLTQQVAVRHLYVKSTLGLDGFEEQRQRVSNQFANIREKFVTKMKDYTSDETKGMVFTEDLKNMIYLAKSDEDVDLVVKMIRRFNSQNNSMRFGNFVFGPVVMRLFYVLNKPVEALNCFKDPELQQFFNQLMSYQVLLDLLYENKMYKEILDVFEDIKERHVDGMKYPRNVVVLVYAALYKLNTKESLDYALKLWNDLKTTGHVPMRRAITFCAGLALRQGNPALALEIVSSCKNQMYATVRNIKVAALAALGRPEDTIPILKSIISVDFPDNTNVKHTFLKEVLDGLRDAVDKSGSPDLTLEFDRIIQLFEKEGHIYDVPLDEQLSSEIQSPAFIRKPRFQKFQRDDFNQRRVDNRYSVYKMRPGLSELQ